MTMLKVKQRGLRGRRLGPWKDEGPHPEEGLFLHILCIPLAGSQPPLRIPPQKLGVGAPYQSSPLDPGAPPQYTPAWRVLTLRMMPMASADRNRG